MAANVDSPKRRSVRLQDEIVAAEDETASNSSGSRGRASKAKTLSSERRRRRIDTEGSAGARSKQYSSNGGLEEDDTGQGVRGTARKDKGGSFRGAHSMQPNVGISAHSMQITVDIHAPPMETYAAKSAPSMETYAAKSAPSMETNAAKEENKLQPSSATNAPSMEMKADRANASHSPAGDHGKRTRSRHNHSDLQVEEPRGAFATPNTSFNRETRSSKAKDPASSPAVIGGSATSGKEKKNQIHLTEPSFEKDQGSEGPGGSSGHDRSLRSRRSRDGSSTVEENSSRGASATPNTSFSRETRSSKAKDPASSPAVSGRGEGATSGKKKKNQVHLTEPSFEKDQGSEGPGGSSGHDRSLRSRRSQDGSSTVWENSSRGASETKRETRSSGRSSGTSTVIRGKAISDKEDMENTDVAEVGSQQGGGLEDPGGSSGHNKSHRSRRSREGSSIIEESSSRGASATKRQTRSSSGRNHESSGASTAVRSESAVLSKEKVENADVAEVESQKGEDPGGSSSHHGGSRSRRSRERSSLNVKNSPKGASSSTSSRKTRTSGAKDLHEPGLSIVAGVVSRKEKHKNPEIGGTSTQEREGSEDPGGNSSHDRSGQPSSSTVNVEEIPRGANVLFSKRTRSSTSEELRESNAVKGLGDGAASSKTQKENVHLAKQYSESCGGSNSHNIDLLRLRSHEVSSVKGENTTRGLRSPTKSQVLATKEDKAGSQKDCGEGALFSAAQRKDIVRSGQEEGVIRPSNQSGEMLEVSGGDRSLRPRRSHEGSGTSGEVNNRRDRTPSKKTTEPIISTEVPGVPGGYISPGKKDSGNLEGAVRPHCSNHDMESNTGEAARDYKVQCCSKQLLQEVLGMCTGICKEMLDSQPYLNEEQKQQHHKNFVWNFETAFQENVRINGLSWHEAPDQDSEPDIKILEDQLDEAMVETSMKRKRYPRKILSHFVKSLKTEREVLNQYKPVVNPVKVSLDPALELRMKDLSATAATVSQHIHETKKALPIQLEKAEGFSQVLSLQPVLEGSHMRNNIFHSRVVIEDISKSVPKILETTPTENEPQKLAIPLRSLRKRKSPLPQGHLYPVQSKRKINLDSQ